MAIPIVITQTNPRTFVPSTSRYINSTVLQYSNQNILTFATYKRNPIPESVDDKFTIIPPGEEFRPDLTSYRAFNTVDYWWRIMEANNIFDIYDYRSGLNIRLPTPFNIF